MGTHTPWSYDAQTVRVYNALARLHLHARPLILKLWRTALRTGTPIARPLWLAYPGDRRAAAEDQEWLLGPNVLVAPVVKQGATGRNVYFPRGCWSTVSHRRHRRGHHFHGRRSVFVRAGLTTLSYYVRCGTRPFAVRRARRHS